MTRSRNHTSLPQSPSHYCRFSHLSHLSPWRFPAVMHPVSTGTGTSTSARLIAAACIALVGSWTTAEAATPRTPPAPQAAPAAQVLLQIDAPEQVDPQWKARVCDLLPQPCKADSLRLFRLRGAPETAGFTVIADEPLAMAEVSRDSSGTWRLGKLSDFSQYKHSESAEQGDRSRRSLAPALYPIGPGRWAAAVLLTFSESYSGGGAAFSTADFVPLDEAARPDAKPAHAGVAFSCYRMVRACFSEKEYKTSPHCHDETTGSLRMKYLAGTRPAEPYRWEYLWRETEWPAHKAERAAVTTSSRFTDEGGSASWCGGPQG